MMSKHIFFYQISTSFNSKLFSSGVSSFTDLISHRVHRAFLWIIGVLTILGNILVLGGRGLARTENRILAMFVKVRNLYYTLTLQYKDTDNIPFKM